MNLGRKNDVTKQLQTSKTCEGETEKDTDRQTTKTTERGEKRKFINVDSFTHFLEQLRIPQHRCINMMKC